MNYFTTSAHGFRTYVCGAVMHGSCCLLGKFRGRRTDAALFMLDTRLTELAGAVSTQVLTNIVFDTSSSSTSSRRRSAFVPCASSIGGEPWRKRAGLTSYPWKLTILI